LIHPLGAPTTTRSRPECHAGADDAVILPLALAAWVVGRVLRAAFWILVQLLDLVVAGLSVLVRFLLAVARLSGDGITALLAGVAGILPLPSVGRAAVREWVFGWWSWLRQWVSYQAFEAALERAFETGMAWVFRKCRALEPWTALLVIVCAALWLPLSFGISTAMHAVLLAKATLWPAWLQLLHPFATLVAKSKLLVVPVYPAAWPQAKKHPLMRGTLAFVRAVRELPVVRKFIDRYRRIELAFAETGRAVRRLADRTGLAPIGPAGIADNPRQSGAFSHQAVTWFKHVSIKFSAEYYEAKDRAAGMAHRDDRGGS
jgi:hypothetical protein